MKIKTLLSRLHLYLGVFFTPLLLLFSITGAAQVFRLHETPKDGSYVPPQWLHDLAGVHIRGVFGSIKDVNHDYRELLQWLTVGLGLALAVTTLIGVYLAFTRTAPRKRWLPMTALALGLIIPGGLLLLQ